RVPAPRTTPRTPLPPSSGHAPRARTRDRALPREGSPGALRERRVAPGRAAAHAEVVRPGPVPVGRPARGRDRARRDDRDRRPAPPPPPRGARPPSPRPATPPPAVPTAPHRANRHGVTQVDPLGDAPPEPRRRRRWGRRIGITAILLVAVAAAVVVPSFFRSA